MDRHEKRPYRHEKRPVDLCVVAGLNNIIKKQTTNQIMEEIEGFANTVLSQSQEYHPEVSINLLHGHAVLPATAHLVPLQWTVSLSGGK